MVWQWKNFDYFLLLPIVIISGISLAVIGSSAPYLVWNQALYFILGMILLVLTAGIDYRMVKPFWFYLYFLTVLCFFLVFIFGEPVRGVVRWISLPGGFHFQFSEFGKPLFILVLAGFLSKFSVNNWKSLLIAGSLLVLPMVFLVKQPDLGTGLVYAVLFLSLVFAAGIRWRVLGAGLLLGFIVLPLTWSLLKDYQQLRIISFLNPGLDPQGAGYNAVQAVIAVGSGEIFGRGLGQGTQSHLRFLPEQHTDFIFATLAEELGLIGVMIFISLLFFILIRLLKILSQIDDPFGRLIIIGVLVIFFSQTIINIGMNVGLLPVTGITLPLVSYGGSSVLATLTSFGLVESVKMFAKERKQTFVIR